MPAAHPRLDAIPGIASCLAITVAALVLAGWTWDIDPLKRVLPGLVSMNPMTAVAFILTGLSLWLQRAPEGAAAPATRTRRFARLAAATVVAIGLFRLAAVALGWDAGVDQWLFTDRLADHNAAFPNRMAPNTALNFVLLGLALATLGTTTRRGRRLAELLASAVFLIALLALTGYAYRVPEFTGVASFIPMALPTAVVFASLAVGVFVARQDSGMMAVITGPSSGGVMARRLLPGMVLALLVLGWLRLEGERQGLYGPGLGVALFTVTNIVVFATLIWWSANSLHRADAQRESLAAQQRDSEAQVRLLLDSTAEAIYGIDAHGHCTFINRACGRMLGYVDGQELLGKDMHALIHHTRPDGTPYPVEDCHIYQAVRTATPSHVEDEVFWRADGTSFAVEYWSHPMRRHGHLVGAVVTFLDVTARKQAEDRLRQSEERTRATIETASDAFIAIDAHGIVIGWNRQAEVMFGWTREETLGRRLSEMILPHQHRARHEQGLRRFAATGEGPVLNTRIEITALRRSGEEFPIELAIWPVLADGIHTFNAFIRDITERRQADEIQAKFGAIIASSADAIISKTLDGIITSWNPSAEKIFGYTAQEAVGQPMAMLIPPECAGEEAQILARIARGEGIEHFETVRVTRDGTRIDIAATISPIQGGSGNIIGASQIARDITGRKHAEERLRQSEQEIERFFGLSLDMLCIASADGYFKRLSPAFGKILGWSEEEMLARPFLDFVHPEDHAATLAEVDRQVTAGEPVLKFDNRYRHKNGSWRLLSWRSVPHGELMYATARDVTESRQAEQRIIDLNTELTERQIALEIANKELEAFSYSISHDLRAPLRHIDGYARMLVEDVGEVLDGDPRRYLDAIGNSARHMGMLIDDLLAFSRLGRKPVERVAVDMDVLARRALEEARDGKTGTAQVSLGPLPPVHADPVLLRQVWVNLLSNALKYSATRGNDARVEVSGQSDGKAVRYQVRDNGVGFDMRYADKLFSVFQRLHSQEEFEGTGVGLAIVQRIVTRHGGRVWAEAELGRGATFTIELPLVDVKSMEAA